MAPHPQAAPTAFFHVAATVRMHHPKVYGVHPPGSPTGLSYQTFKSTIVTEGRANTDDKGFVQLLSDQTIT